MPCKSLVKFFVSTLRFLLGVWVFCESDGYLLFILVQLTQSDLTTFLRECLHDLFKQFQENGIFCKMQVWQSQVLNLFI